MPRLMLHGEKQVDEPELHLKLLKDDLGAVIAAVDKDGNPMKGGSIVRILNNGTMVRVPALSDKLGLKLNPKGQILEKSVE